MYAPRKLINGQRRVGFIGGVLGFERIDDK